MSVFHANHEDFEIFPGIEMQVIQAARYGVLQVEAPASSDIDMAKSLIVVQVCSLACAK